LRNPPREASAISAPAVASPSSNLEARRGFVEDGVGARDGFPGIDPVGEDRARQRDEIRSGRRHSLDRSDVGTRHHDRRYLDHLGPPSAERQVALVRLWRVVVSETAEENVVRALLAEFERIVAGFCPARANRYLRLEVFDRLRQR